MQEFFSEHKAIATAVTHVADAYRKLEKHEKACEIYHYVVDNWPKDEHAMWSQMGLVISNTCLGNNNLAEIAFKKLFSDYSGNELLAKAICLVADNYRRLERNEKACELYQRALDNKPDIESALWSQMGLAISHIGLGDYDAAGAAVDKLLADFADYDRISIATCMIADEYRKSNKYEEASELYQNVIDNWPDAEHALWSQMGLAISNLRLGKEYAAQQAFDKLRTDFVEDERMAIAGCFIGDEYRILERYGKACELYQYVNDKWPDTEKAMWSLANMGNIKLNLGDEAAAQAILNRLIADFADQPDLPRALWQAAEVYYNHAFLHEKEGRDAKTREYFTKVITLGQRIREQSPASSATMEAHLITGECYRRLGQYLKAIKYFQKVVDDWPDYKYACNAQCIIGECYEKLRDSVGLPKSEAEPKIEQAYQAVIEKYPDCSLAGHACLKLAWPNFKKGRWAEAATYFELFVQKSPDDPRSSRVLYDLGQAYEKMGKLDRAVKIYSIFLEIAEPGDPRIKSVKTQLEKLRGVQK